MQSKLLTEVARDRLVACKPDPQSLLAYLSDWLPVDEVLHTQSNRRGWLVFDDRILDSEGQRLLAPWQTQDSHFEFSGGASAPSDREPAPLVDREGTHMTNAAKRVPKPQPDVVLVTVNIHETRAIYDAFQAATGTPPVPVPLDGRVYRNLGTLNGSATIFHALSEMGSGSIGAMQQTVDKAIRALAPGAIIAVGVGFGVNAKMQAIGDILLSKQLRLYDLQRVGNEIILRDDKPHASAAPHQSLRGLSHKPTWHGAKVTARG